MTGNANVFEATFRMSILDASGKVIADVQVMATCGSGCRGTFDTTIPYAVSKGQYGTLHAYNPSAKDGTPKIDPRLPGVAHAEGLIPGPISKRRLDAPGTARGVAVPRPAVAGEFGRSAARPVAGG